MQITNIRLPWYIHRPSFQGLHDLQQDPPAAWCAECGMEVQESDQVLCPACRKEKEYAVRTQKPLRPM